MQDLKWTDNNCTVGWTNIYAVMTAADMYWLASMHPKGIFTNCFCPSKPLGWDEDKHNPETFIPHLISWGDEEPHRSFYFDFPIDQKGKILLIALQVKGMTGKRFCSARWPEFYHA